MISEDKVLLHHEENNLKYKHITLHTWNFRYTLKLVSRKVSGTYSEENCLMVYGISAFLDNFTEILQENQ